MVLWDSGIYRSYETRIFIHIEKNAYSSLLFTVCFVHCKLYKLWQQSQNICRPTRQENIGHVTVTYSFSDSTSLNYSSSDSSLSSSGA